MEKLGSYGGYIVEVVETLGLSSGCIEKAMETLGLSDECIVESVKTLGLYGGCIAKSVETVSAFLLKFRASISLSSSSLVCSSLYYSALGFSSSSSVSSGVVRVNPLIVPNVADTTLALDDTTPSLTLTGSVLIRGEIAKGGGLLDPTVFCVDFLLLCSLHRSWIVCLGVCSFWSLLVGGHNGGYCGSVLCCIVGEKLVSNTEHN